MTKKKRYDVKGKKRQKNSREEDAVHRITYLWGASHLMAQSSPTLSRFYNSTIKKIGRRINLSLDALTMKRYMCKKCSSLLIAGAAKSGVKYRLASRRQSHVVLTCGNCGELRRFVNHGAQRKKKQQLPQPPLKEANVTEKATTSGCITC